MHDKIARLVSGGAEEAGMKGWREHAADMPRKRGKIKFASGPVSSDSFLFPEHTYYGNVPHSGIVEFKHVKKAELEGAVRASTSLSATQRTIRFPLSRKARRYT